MIADEFDEDNLHLRFRGLESARPAGDVNGDGDPDVLFTAPLHGIAARRRLDACCARRILYGNHGGLAGAASAVSGLDHIYYATARPDRPTRGDHGADFYGDRPRRHACSARPLLP